MYLLAGSGVGFLNLVVANFVEVVPGIYEYLLLTRVCSCPSYSPSSPCTVLPQVLVLWPPRHGRAGHLRALLADGAVDEVDAVEEVHHVDGQPVVVVLARRELHRLQETKQEEGTISNASSFKTAPITTLQLQLAEKLFAVVAPILPADVAVVVVVVVAAEVFLAKAETLPFNKLPVSPHSPVGGLFRS